MIWYRFYQLLLTQLTHISISQSSLRLIFISSLPALIQQLASFHLREGSDKSCKQPMTYKGQNPFLPTWPQRGHDMVESRSMDLGLETVALPIL